MPPVSERQTRAMYAAREGKSTLGIPRAVGQEFVGNDDAPNAAGVVHVSPEGRVLLMHRAPEEKNYGGHWGLPGGKAEDGETPEDAARRETKEETGYEHKGDLKILDRVRTPNGMIFTTFAAPVEKEFAPEMADGEHTGFTWADLQHLPQPLHPNVATVLGDHIGVTEDMTPEDWEGLRNGFLKWTREEEREPEHAADSIAFDRASVRRVDQDGHLFVETTPISKANVCPYYGREIPDHDKLGLDPDRIYQLYRDPDELKKAAQTFAGKPLLNLHTPVGADDHPTDAVVGTVGDKVEFKPPYLMAPLRVWDGDAIDQIQSGAQKELSCGYRYRADMTPGEHDGQKYDGVMRDIVGNHVALVEEGRAGPDVMVGDQAMKRDWKRLFALDESEEAKERARGKFSEMDKEVASSHVHHREDMPASAFLEPASRKYPVKEKKDGEWKYDRDLLLAAARRARMNKNESLAARADAIRKREFGSANDRKDPLMGKKLLTRKAALAQGAVMAYLAPKLAQDAKVDLAPIFRGITAKNFKAKRDNIVSALQKATDGKLAKDASLEDVTGLLDALEDCTPAEDDANNGVPNMAVRGEDEEPDQKSKVKDFLKDKLSEDDMEALDALMDDDDQEAMDEDEEEKKENEREGENLKEREAKEKAEDEEQKDMVDKKAMDAAIKAAVAKERQTARDIETAKEDVRPYIGKVSIACDSAADVYKIALDAMKVDVRDVPPVAYKAILKAQPVPRTDRPAVSMAADAKGAKSFAERFPSAARITAA